MSSSTALFLAFSLLFALILFIRRQNKINKEESYRHANDYKPPSNISSEGLNKNKTVNESYVNYNVLPNSENHIILPGNLVFHSNPNGIGKYLFVDTETTGLPKKRDDHPWNTANWPRIVSISWIILDDQFSVVKYCDRIIRQYEPIPEQSILIHGITNVIAEEKGKDPFLVMTEFLTDYKTVDYIIAHNVEFDIPIIESELFRIGITFRLTDKMFIDTMFEGAKYHNVINYKSLDIYGRKNKISLKDLAKISDPRYIIDNAHNSLSDVALTAHCFIKMNSTIIFNTRHFDPKYCSTDFRSLFNFNIFKEDVDFPDNPFYRKSIVITGDFDNFLREDMQEVLYDFGAKINTQISKKTDIVIFGSNPGPAKRMKINDLKLEGFKIEILFEGDVLREFKRYHKNT
jgi:DNA polymerase III epsilon subunit-like protein